MCGRYFVDVEFEELMKRYNIYSNTSDIDFKIGEVFPSNKMPVITSKNSKTSIEFMKWGFSMTATKKLLINARSETAYEKRTFKYSLLSKRCIVPASGFYEWQKKGDKKIKHAISTKEKICSLAGLYQDFLVDNKWERAYVILTKESDAQMAELHHRVPVIIRPSDEEVWLNENFKNTRHLNELMKQTDLEFNIEIV